MASVVFWRPPLTSSQFRKEDRHLASGLIPADRSICGGATRPFSEIAGWIPCLGVVPDFDVNQALAIQLWASRVLRTSSGC